MSCGVGWLPPLLVLVGCWASLWLAHPQLTQPWPFQILFALAFAAYLAALLQLPRICAGDPRAQIGLTLGGTLLLHALLLPAPFAFSDDMFRYVWNGRVSAAGIDPYRYAPGDPALAPLRDSLIWPNVNAPEQPSPYPPLAEAATALSYRLWPERLEAMKIGMSVLNLAAIALLIRLLHNHGKAPALALIYAWNPQTSFQIAFSGHNDALLVVLMILALWLAETRRPDRYLLAGWALGLAILAKFLPILALPFVWRRWGFRAVLVCVATVVTVYAALLPHGQRVFNGLVYEAGTAQFNDGIYYLLYHTSQILGAPDPHLPARILAAIGLGMVLIWLLWRPHTSVATGLSAMLAAYLLFSPAVMAWYTLWILPFLALGVLPNLLPLNTAWPVRVFGSYWIIFSGSVILSELYFFTDRPTWIVAHVLAYLIPSALLLRALLLTRLRRQTTRSINDVQF